jgi:hypothetical protein
VNTGAGFLLIIGGLLLLYTVVTGRFAILEETFYKLFNLPAPEPAAAPKSQSEQDKQASGHLDVPNIGMITLPNIFIPDYTTPAHT